MKNTLLNKFKILARLLALTLLLGTGQAQAVIWFAAVPPVIKVVVAGVTTFVGGYGGIEGYKWATGYEEPKDPKDPKDPPETRNTDTLITPPSTITGVPSSPTVINTGAANPSSASSSGSASADDVNPTASTGNQFSSNSNSTESITPTASTGDLFSPASENGKGATSTISASEEVSPSVTVPKGNATPTLPVTETPSPASENGKGATSTISASEEVSPSVTVPKGNATPTLPVTETPSPTRSTVDSQTPPTSENEQSSVSSTGSASIQDETLKSTPVVVEKQRQKDQASAGFYKTMQDLLKPKSDTSPLSAEDVNRREALKLAQERLAEQQRQQARKDQGNAGFYKTMQDLLKPRSDTSPLSAEDVNRREALKLAQERLAEQQRQQARKDQGNAEFYKTMQDLLKPRSDTSPLSAEDVNRREALKLAQERLAEQQRQQVRKDQGNAEFYKTMQDLLKPRSDTSPLSAEDVNRREALKLAQERLAEQQRQQARKDQGNAEFYKTMQDLLKPRSDTSPLSAEDVNRREALKLAQERLAEQQRQQARKDQANAEFYKTMQDLLKPRSDTSPLSAEDLKKREELRKKQAARDEANKSFFEKMKNKFKQPQTPVSTRPEEEEKDGEEEPETPPLEDINEDFINRNEEFEDELNDEDETDRGEGKRKGGSGKPDTVPKLNESAETHLQGARALTHGSALMTMEAMSGFRNAMGLYRSGRAFSFGTASLDNVSAQEMLASTDPVHQLPAFNREIGSWHNFVQIHGFKANRDQMAGLPGGSITGQGMTAGLFYQLDPELVTGMMLSVHKNTYGFDSGQGSGSLENVRIGPFLSWTSGDFHLDASLTLAHNNYSLKRKDSAGNALKASFGGHEIAAYTGIGYDIHLDSWTQGLTLTPMAELLYVRSQNGGYTEESQSAEAMKVAGGKNSQLITRYGLEASYLFPNLESPTEVKARLGRQRHNMAGQSSGYSMQGGGSGTLSIPAFAENATFVGLGFYRKVSDYSHISLNYNGTKSKHGLSHGLQFNFESKF